MSLDVVSYAYAKKALREAKKPPPAPKLNFSLQRWWINDGNKLLLARFINPTEKLIKVWKALMATEYGTSLSGLKLIIQDLTNNVEIYSTESNVVQEGEPLASGGMGADIEICVNNGSGKNAGCLCFACISIE